MPEVRTRSAPSPTGDPHVGTFYNALVNYAFAKKYGGRYILRIEDTDQTRFAEGSEDKLYQAFEWLHFKPDEGVAYGGNFGPYRQSERLEKYAKYAQELVDRGAAYYCFCTQERLQKLREEQQAQKIIPTKYDRFCLKLTPKEIEKKLEKNEPHVIRLKVPDQGTTSFNDLIRGTITFENKLIDDQVLLKSDGFPTYHLAVVVDDYLMKISHVIRAEEWISSTPKHILLYEAFDWPLPLFAHTPLLRNPDHSKMSKRKNPTSVFWYKEQGFLPTALINYLALMGWSHPQGKEIFSLEEFVEKFDITRMDPAGPIFDLKKLEWLNGIWLRQDQNIDDQIYNFYNGYYPKEFIEKTLSLTLERINKLIDYKELVDFIFEEQLSVSTEEVKRLLAKYDPTKVNNILQSFLSDLSNLSNLSGSEWKAEKIHNLLNSQLEKLQTNPREAYMILRIALSGKTVGPPLFESMEIMEKNKVIKRLTHSLS